MRRTRPPRPWRGSTFVIPHLDLNSGICQRATAASQWLGQAQCALRMWTLHIRSQAEGTDRPPAHALFPQVQTGRQARSLPRPPTPCTDNNISQPPPPPTRYSPQSRKKERADAATHIPQPRGARRSRPRSRRMASRPRTGVAPRSARRRRSTAAARPTTSGSLRPTRRGSAGGSRTRSARAARCGRPTSICGRASPGLRRRQRLSLRNSRAAAAAAAATRGFMRTHRTPPIRCGRRKRWR